MAHSASTSNASILSYSPQGFSLLELLLVVTVLSAVAWMSLGIVNNDSDQIRFEDTRNRLKGIKRAIIGDTSRTINGSPELRGYVADMGSFPPNIQALLTKKYCEAHPEVTSSGSCSTTFHTQADYQLLDYTATTTTHTDTNGVQTSGAHYSGYSMRLGWNGPYIDSAWGGDYQRFLDGWGNDDTATNNYGWRYTLGSSPADLTVQSVGRDGYTGGSTDFDKDYPESGVPLINESQYQVTITDSSGNGGVFVNYGNHPLCWQCSESIASPASRAACLSNVPPGVWSPDPAYSDSVTCSAQSNHAWQSGSEEVCLVVIRKLDGHFDEVESLYETYNWDGTLQTDLFSFYDGATFMMGQYLYELFYYNTTGSSCTTVPFFSASAEWKSFSIIPGATLQPLPAGN